MSNAASMTMPVAAAPAREHLSPNQQAWRRFRRNYVAVISSFFVLGLVFTVLIWPLLGRPSISKSVPEAMTYSPTALTDQTFKPPSGEHWLGTDANGRDILSRMFYGARISLVVGVVGATVSLIIGVLWGAAAGYLGGRTDNYMMRFVDILYSLPSIIFVIVLLTTLVKPGVGPKTRLTYLFIGLGAVSWLTMARIVRGQVLSLRARQFVDASLSMGAGHVRILFSHILPNVLGIVIVYLTLLIPSIILYESFLSYLGLGIQPPQASLGSLIAEGAAQINPIRTYWWMIAFPAGLLAMTLLALNFVGDGLRDAFDPRTKG